MNKPKWEKVADNQIGKDEEWRCHVVRLYQVLTSNSILEHWPTFFALFNRTNSCFYFRELWLCLFLEAKEKEEERLRGLIESYQEQIEPQQETLGRVR